MADHDKTRVFHDDELLGDDFDYEQEIREIEAQEAELRKLREQKKAEAAKRRQAQASAQTTKTKTAKKEPTRRERRENRKEAEWLGEAFDDSTGSVKNQKKRSKAPIVVAVLLILALAAGGGAYAFKMQSEKQAVAAFEQKVAAFQSEKLDNVQLGSHQAYFDDFMAQCEKAIEDKDLAAIAELNGQWEEVEKELTDVSSGKSALDAFATSATEALSAYAVTEGSKESYEAFTTALKDAQEKNAYDQLSNLQSQLDSLLKNMKSNNDKEIQNLKNDIAEMDLDDDFITDNQKKSLSDYNSKVDQQIKEEDYSGAVATLQEWKRTAGDVEKSIASKKAESESIAESEAEVRRKAASESEAKAQSEAVARAESERKASESSSSSNSGSSSSSSKSGDYILPDSSSRYLKASDVKNLSSYQLMIARNEIYARHGRKFNDASLQQYFNSKSWYKGTVDADKFSTSVFNDYEIKNIDLILSYE